MQSNAEHPPRPRGRPVGSGEGRDTTIRWRTTPERQARLAAAAAQAGLSQAAALDAALDAWLKKHGA